MRMQRYKLRSQDRNGDTVPTEVEFVSADGTDAHYRFMLADVINQQLKDIKFKGAEFDVTIEPSQKMLKDLTYFNSILGAYEANFSPKLKMVHWYLMLVMVLVTEQRL